MKKQKSGENLRNSYSGRFVNYTSGGIRVDVARYLKSDEGKEALDRLEKSSERFEKKEKLTG